MGKVSFKQPLTPMEGEDTVPTNELKIKRSKAYFELMKKFINFTDNQGKTALHYAAFRD